MNKAVDVGEFFYFRIIDDISFDMLQFADDSVSLGNGRMENLWGLKVVLRGFEILSGPKVNFFKIMIYNINLSEKSLSTAAFFLIVLILFRSNSWV